MLQPNEVDIQIEVAVLKNRLDHIDESIHAIRDQIDDLNIRIGRMERFIWAIGGALILIQALPQVMPYLA